MQDPPELANENIRNEKAQEALKPEEGNIHNECNEFASLILKFTTLLTEDLTTDVRQQSRLLSEPRSFRDKKKYVKYTCASSHETKQHK